MNIIHDHHYDIEAIKEALWAKYQSSKFELDRHEKRFNHSQMVAKKAVELAQMYAPECDLNKVEATGLLHDYAKFVELPEFEAVLKEYHQDVSILNNSFKILHSLVGPYVIKHDLGITDEELLYAVETHTIGASDMSKLGELIYLADFIEDSRPVKLNDNNIDIFGMTREVARTDFYKAIAYKTEFNMANLIKKHVPIQDNTLATYVKYRDYLK